MNTDITRRIEAFLFTEGGTLSLRRLETALHLKRDELLAGLTALAGQLEGRGISLVYTDTEASLTTSREVSSAIEEVYKQELDRDIGDAGLEVLAIVLYRGPSTRAQIDYIRGVNTSSTVRNLLSRGLLERAGNPEDGREYLYRPTTELLAHLGIRTTDELSDYSTIKTELATFESQQHTATNPYGTTGEQQ
jgi:segregation and condensation protein B